MRPIKVTMTAFGPYKNSEVVDFNELNNHKLFVISGSTGAGKTTIFDAICFALYGNASGEDRNDIRMLRSDFAEDDVFTSVNFEFELKGRTYRVLRQIAHVKKGNKTATGDKYELYENKGGKEVPLTDRFIVSQVDGKIQELIGLTKEQFSQIVMLPQGEFRKLLTSETENKEEVLRKIFKTSFYKTVAEHLNIQKRDTQKKFDEHVKERDIYIQHVKASLPNREGSELDQVFSQDYFNTNQVINGLDKEITFYDEAKQFKHTELQVKVDQLQELNNRYLYAKRLNERFDLLEAKRKAKEDLDQKREDMQNKEQSFILGEKASHLEVLEKHYLDILDEVKEKQKNVADTQMKETLAKQVLRDAQTNYQQEEQNSGVREKVTLELERLSEFLPIISELDKKKKKINQISRNVERLAKSETTLDTDLKQKQAEKILLISKIKPLDENVRMLPDKTEKIAIMREKVTVLREYLKLTNSYREQFKETELAKTKFEKSEIEYNHLETRWIEGQASLLATHLHDGKPCPVCGSIDHPRRGEITEEIPTKEELEEKRKIKREIEQAFNLSKAELSNIIQQLEEKKKAVIEHEFVPEDAQMKNDEIVMVGKELAREVEQLKKDQKELVQLRQIQETIESEIDLSTIKINELRIDLHESKLQYQTEKSLYEQSISKIPEDLQSLESLEIRINETKHEKQQLEIKWKQAKVEYQTSSEKLATASANYQNCLEQLRVSKLKREQSEAAFHDAMLKAGFENREIYSSSKMNPLELKTLKVEIEDYNTAVKTVMIQLKDLEEELRGQERSDLAELKDAVSQAGKQVEEIRNDYQQMQNYFEKAQEGITNILEADKGLQEVEQQLQLIRDLFDVVRGENKKKISFERYLQIEFLEQIIIAANERLKHLSNGQYMLVRSDRLEKRGRQSGLGLDVLDNYTGLYRDVKTLSGGEKFNASLCLALGMADVIQSYEGGISIETMFIDEGFGSLDEESLNKAIDTLIDLQKSGRMIGVISHVQELKQAIPAILEVKKTKEGYSQTRFVIT